MITLHHLDNSRSQRVLWLLEELALPYEIQFYKRDPQTMLAPKALLDVHPLGKSPVITDDKIVLAESGAIIEYLVEKYASETLRPKSFADRLKYSYWLHYAEGSLMPPLLMKLIFARLSQKPMPFFMRPIGALIGEAVLKSYIHPEIKRHLVFIEGELNKSEYFAGSAFSAADIQMSFPLEAASSRIGFEKYPKLKSFLARIHERPAYKRALEKGGPFTI